MSSRWILTGTAVTALFCLAAPDVASQTQAPPGPFRTGIELPTQLPVTPAMESALRDLGVNYVNFYVSNDPGTDLPEEETRAAVMGLCERLGLDFSLACHHLAPGDEIFRAAAKDGGNRYKGLVIDEFGHIRLMFPEFAPPSLPKEDMLGAPSTFTSLEQADEAVFNGFARLKARYDALGAPRVVDTDVWPALLHTAARAGWTPCPKICKELYSPVSLAIGMGAALEYGRELWVDVDMWYFYMIPGHSPEEVFSNLQLAYWLGADLVYLEGSGYNLIPAGKQGTPFSLVNVITDTRYQLTPHGEMLKRFCRDYLPAHPRSWSFRDVRPNMAIIRFDDTDFGQKSWGQDRLFGTTTLKSDADTAAWLSLWNVLTHGRTGNDGLAHFKGSVKQPANDARYHQQVAPSYATDLATGEHRFFVPINGAVVYDHLVGYEHLKGVPLLFITGKMLSDRTLAAVRQCVAEGAVCVAWGRLATRLGLAANWSSGVQVMREGKGRFVLTDDFAAPDAVAQYASFLGRDDEIRYGFGGRNVVLRRVTDNTVDVVIEEVHPE